MLGQGVQLLSGQMVPVGWIQKNQVEDRPAFPQFPDRGQGLRSDKGEGRGVKGRERKGLQVGLNGPDGKQGLVHEGDLRGPTAQRLDP